MAGTPHAEGLRLECADACSAEGSACTAYEWGAGSAQTKSCAEKKANASKGSISCRARPARAGRRALGTDQELLGQQ